MTFGPITTAPISTLLLRAVTVTSASVLAICAPYDNDSFDPETPESIVVSVYESPAAGPADDLPPTFFPVDVTDDPETDETFVGLTPFADGTPFVEDFVYTSTWPDAVLDTAPTQGYVQVELPGPDEVAPAEVPVVPVFVDPDPEPDTDESFAAGFFDDITEPLVPIFPDPDDEPGTDHSLVGWLADDVTEPLVPVFVDPDDEPTTDDSFVGSDFAARDDITEPLVPIFVDPDAEPETDDSIFVQAEFVDQPPPVGDYLYQAAWPDAIDDPETDESVAAGFFDDISEPITTAFVDPDEEPGTDESLTVQAEFVDGPPPEAAPIYTASWPESIEEEIAEAYAQVEAHLPLPPADTTEPLVPVYPPPDTEPETEDSVLAFTPFDDGQAFVDEFHPTFWPIELPDDDPVADDSIIEYGEYTDDTTDVDLDFGEESDNVDETLESVWSLGPYADGVAQEADFVTAWFGSEDVYEEPATDESVVGSDFAARDDITEPQFPVFADDTFFEETEESVTLQATYVDGDAFIADSIFTYVSDDFAEPETEDSITVQAEFVDGPIDFVTWLASDDFDEPATEESVTVQAQFIDGPIDWACIVSDDFPEPDTEDSIVYQPTDDVTEPLWPVMAPDSFFEETEESITLQAEFVDRPGFAIYRDILTVTGKKDIDHAMTGRYDKDRTGIVARYDKDLGFTGSAEEDS